MEWDFMGLNSTEALTSVKQEIPDEGPETQWSFMKKSSSHPHFMSFMGGASQDDGMKKMVSDPVTSSAFIASTAVFDHLQKTSVGEFQTSPLSFSNPLLKSNFTSYGENFGSPTPTTRQQFMGIPVTVASPVGPIVGFTNSGNNNKPVAGPAQMTIFYGGTVNVYDEISPEKAQAIMLLAGNGSSFASNMTPTRPQVSAPVIKASPTAAEAIVVSNQPMSSQPGPSLQNELYFSSNPSVQTGSDPASKDEEVVTKTTGISSSEVMTKTTGISSSPVCKPEPQRVVSSRGPIHLPVLAPSAVPQSRKASLARFLEKRKERVMTVAPYSCEKKDQEGITQGNNN